MTKQVKKSPRALRKFGLVMTVPLLILGALLWWKGKPAAPYLLALAGFFLIIALVLPRILQPIEWVWMKLAHILSAIMTRVILTLTFYLVITPLGLAMRLLGKDLLHLKFEQNRQSYWVPVEPDGPQSRPDKPY